MHHSKHGRITQPKFVGAQLTSLCAQIGTSHSPHLPSPRNQIAADLLRLGEPKLDQPGGAVSGFVQHAVSVALDDVAGWGAMLAEALRETGGALSDGERAGADDVLGTSSRPAA
jgi:hypothetical protein